MTSDNNGIDYLMSKDGGHARKRTRSSGDEEKRSLEGRGILGETKTRGQNSCFETMGRRERTR